jgi:hypothetical protein
LQEIQSYEIEHIISGLLDALHDPNPGIQPKDQFKEDHPNYRDYYVDSQSSLTENPGEKKTTEAETKQFKIIRKEYQSNNSKPREPVKPREEAGVQISYFVLFMRLTISIDDISAGNETYII